MVRWDSVGCIRQGFANVSIQINEPYRCIALHLGFLESIEAIEAFIGGMEILTGTHARDAPRETRRAEGRDAPRGTRHAKGALGENGPRPPMCRVGEERRMGEGKDAHEPACWGGSPA